MTSQLERWSQAWAQNWPGIPPEAHLLKHHFPERWVRFHSLPESKRYPDTKDEYRIILKRHHTVLDELCDHLTDLLIMTWATSETRHPVRKSNIVQATPPARRWQTFEDPFDQPADEHATEPDWTVWRSVFIGRIPRTPEALDPVLRLVADDQTESVMLAPEHFHWLYHPYDGGADVLLPTTAERDALRERHRSWLSDRADGL